MLNDEDTNPPMNSNPPHKKEFSSNSPWDTPLNPLSTAEIEDHIKIFFDPSASNVASSNIYLNNSITWDKWNTFKYLLISTQSPYVKFYCAEALITLYGRNFLEIARETTLEILDYLTSTLFDSCQHYLTQENKYLVNTWTKWYCFLIRVNWVQLPELKRYLHQVITPNNNTEMGETSQYIWQMTFLIDTELIQQFQSIEHSAWTNSIALKVKFIPILIEFKEHILLPIFDHSISTLLRLFQQTSQSDRSNEEELTLLLLIVRCVLECLDFEEDLNWKENNFSKYHIKPVYIPNTKKKQKDKSWDITIIKKIIQWIFDNYTVLIRSNTKNKYTEELSRGYWLILQKFAVMKVVYLGNGKGTVLKCYQECICSLIFNRTHFLHHEEVCRLVYVLQKNYTILDLIQDEQFLGYIVSFANDTFDSIIHSKHPNYEPRNINGFNYWLRFLGYFSRSHHRWYLGIKQLILNSILTLENKIIDNIKFIQFKDINEINDLASSFGICGECCYVPVLKKKNSIIEEITVVTGFNVRYTYIIFALKLIKTIDYALLETQLKSREYDLTSSFNDSISVGETFLPEHWETICNFTVIMFSVLSAHGEGEMISPNDYIYTVSLLKFIKFFCDYFFSESWAANISSSYFDRLRATLKYENIEAFIVSLLSLIYTISISNSKSPTYQTKKLVKKCYQSILTKMVFDKDIQMKTICFSLGKVDFKGKELSSYILSAFNYVFSACSSGDDTTTTTTTTTYIWKYYFNILIFFLSHTNNNHETSLHVIVNSLTMYLSDLHHISLVVITLSSIVNSIQTQGQFEGIIDKIMEIISTIDSIITTNSLQLSNFDLLKLLIKTVKLLNRMILCFHSNKYSLQSNTKCTFSILSIAKDLLDNYYNASQWWTLNTEDKKYLYQIKPVSYLIDLFYNIFSKNITQLNLLININIVYTQGITFKLSRLILGINCVDIFGYTRRFNNVYTLLQYIYCDYIDTVNPPLFSQEELGLVIALISASVDQLHNESVFKGISNMIFTWGKARLDNLNSETTRKIFENGKNAFIQILKNMIKMVIFNNDSYWNWSEDLVKCTYVWGWIYHDEYAEFINSWIGENRSGVFEESLNEKLKNWFEFNDGNISGNFKLFFWRIKEVGMEAKLTSMDYHNKSNHTDKVYSTLCKY